MGFHLFKGCFFEKSQNLKNFGEGLENIFSKGFSKGRLIKMKLQVGLGSNESRHHKNPCRFLPLLNPACKKTQGDKNASSSAASLFF